MLWTIILFKWEKKHTIFSCLFNQGCQSQIKLSRGSQLGRVLNCGTSKEKNITNVYAIITVRTMNTIEERLWKDTKVQKGMPSGRNKNLNDIYKYVKPKLNEIGLDLTPLVGAEEVRTNLPLAQYKIWSTLQMRFEKGGSGNIHRIFSIEDPKHALTAQIFVLQSATPTALGIRANFNIPHNIMEITTNENRVEKMLELLKALDLYLYLHIKPSFFVLIKYSDIPLEGWALTYRKEPTRLNRMRVKSAYLERYYIHYSKFEHTIKSKL